MAKAKIEVLGAVIDGHTKGSTLEVEEKSADYLEKIGYARKLKAAEKPKEKAKPKSAPKKKKEDK